MVRKITGTPGRTPKKVDHFIRDVSYGLVGGTVEDVEVPSSGVKVEDVIVKRNCKRRER